MGCLNSQGQFSHWFSNIHFSGKCNRSCYFCIGQHMHGLDPIDNLDEYPLRGMDEFLEKCRKHNITEVNLTGSDTDPLLYKHLPELVSFLRKEIPGLVLGLRTNGVLDAAHPEMLDLFDKASISITSFNPEIYKKTMGQGSPPDLRAIMARHPNLRLKLNVVLCPETVNGSDLAKTIEHAINLGIDNVNIREPYGQTHIGDPFKGLLVSTDTLFGMPVYEFQGNTEDAITKVVYWDVHYVEVESVNLYANGLVSETYPVTAGHHPTGFVKDQSNFTQGRHVQQWTNKRKLAVIKDPVNF